MVSRITSEEVRAVQAALTQRMAERIKTAWAFSCLWTDRPATFLEAYLTIVSNRRYEEYSGAYDPTEKTKTLYYKANDALWRETRAADDEENWGHLPHFVRGGIIWSAANPRALHQEQYGYVPEDRLPHLVVAVTPNGKSAWVYGPNKRTLIADWEKVRKQASDSAKYGENNRYPCGGYFVILDALKGLYS